MRDSEIEDSIKYLENLGREFKKGQEYIVLIVPTPTGPTIQLHHPSFEKGVQGYGRGLIVVAPTKTKKNDARAFLLEKKELEENNYLNKMLIKLNGGKIPEDDKESPLNPFITLDEVLGISGEGFNIED